MNEELEWLDLERHALEDVHGKYISRHGATYFIGPKVGEGGEATVFLLFNVESGLGGFVLKVGKVRAGSAEAGATLYRHRDLAFLLAFRAANLASGRVRVEMQDTFEFGGGVMRLQRYLGSVETQFSFGALMRDAVGAHADGDFPKAVQICQEVLARNPCHADALLQGSQSLSAMNEHYDAATWLYRAAEIEPCDARIFHALARAHVALGNPESAARTLRLLIDRYPYDWATLQLLVETCLANDLVEAAEQAMDVVRASVSTAGEALNSMEPGVLASRERVAGYELELGRALAAQEVGDWAAGRRHCQQAMVMCRGPLYARINLAVCDYHLMMRNRDFVPAGPHHSDLLPLLARVRGEQLAATAILALLYNCLAGDWNETVGVATLLIQSVSADELTWVPRLIHGDVTVAEPDPGPVLFVVRLIRGLVPADAADAGQTMDRLMAMYEERCRGLAT